MLFKITSENFDGPISLLLQLIEKRKMAINDVSLSKITNDYINFIKKLEEKSIQNISNFILIASILTLIKSKSLLPNLELNKEEELDIYELKKRIKLFKTYQEASTLLKQNFFRNRRFYKAKYKKFNIKFNPHDNLNIDNIIESLNKILSEIPVKEKKKKEAYIKIDIHIENIMSSLEERIKKTSNINFKSFINTQLRAGNNTEELKIYKLVGFLAVLEMVKNEILDVSQDKNFDEISIYSIKKDKDTLIN